MQIKRWNKYVLCEEPGTPVMTSKEGVFLLDDSDRVCPCYGSTNNTDRFQKDTNNLDKNCYVGESIYTRPAKKKSLRQSLCGVQKLLSIKKQLDSKNCSKEDGHKIFVKIGQENTEQKKVDHVPGLYFMAVH